MLHHGDCVEVLRTLPDASVDSVVTDPPYELGFMGKRWDASGIAYSVDLWREALRVLKPGGHLLAFGGTRTYHRMAVAIEDAGFEIRDSLHWVYGSGFPKSKNVSLAIDKGEGHPNRGRAIPTASTYQACDTEREHKLTSNPVEPYVPKTDVAKQWDGWGTALKPSHEPVVVARKPLVGTVADNVQAHGTGALNIDGCRVGTESTIRKSNAGTNGDGWRMGKRSNVNGSDSGRWPPNILLSHTPECGESCVEGCPVAELDRQSGQRISHKHEGPIGRRPGSSNLGNVGGTNKGDPFPNGPTYGDSGGASRFFPVFRYQAKASRSEREQGCASLPSRSGAAAVDREEDSAGMQSPRAGAGRTASAVKNHHPTVKPVALMRWLVRLVTPPKGIVLDPFTGSGTTGVACVEEGFRFIGIEREAEYHAIATARIEHARESLPRQRSLLEEP